MKLTVEDLVENGFEAYSYDEIVARNVSGDAEILDKMDDVGADIILLNFSKVSSQYWFFEDVDSMLRYFESGGKVGVDNHGQLIESLDEFDIEWNKRFGSTAEKPMTAEEHHKFMQEVKAFAEEWNNR